MNLFEQSPHTHVKCSSCKVVKPITDFYKNHRAKSGYREDCKPCVKKQQDRNYRIQHGARINLVKKEESRRVRDEVLKAYGGKCECCGESHKVFLTLDHIHGGGGVHRQKLGARGVYNEVKKLGFPKDKYRILCMNCNFAIRFGRTCPHQLDNLEVQDAGLFA